MTYLKTYFKPTKYNSVKQTYNGYNYDSKLEARYAADLDLRVKGKDLLGYDRQFKVSFDTNGKHICNYYVDFRLHLNDGSYELVEVKGMETEVWRLKRKLLEALWLPAHLDYTYTVVK